MIPQIFYMEQFNKVPINTTANRWVNIMVNTKYIALIGLNLRRAVRCKCPRAISSAAVLKLMFPLDPYNERIVCCAIKTKWKRKVDNSAKYIINIYRNPRSSRLIICKWWNMWDRFNYMAISLS